MEGAMGAVAMSVGLALLVLVTTCVLVGVALAAALPRVPRVPPELAPLTASPTSIPTSSPTLIPTSRPRLRLPSRILFASRSAATITLDCALVRPADVAGVVLPPHLAPPPGLPFTLQLRAPTVDWFAGRVEELLRAWAEEDREVVVELREDRGRVRTTVASEESSVHLELAGVAGLAPALPPS